VELGDTDWEPEVALLPLQPLLAVQLVALVEDQVIVELWPEVIEEGAAEMVTAGTGGPINSLEPASQAEPCGLEVEYLSKAGHPEANPAGARLIAVAPAISLLLESISAAAVETVSVDEHLGPN
jgi:DNA-binding phage protein